MMSRWFNLFVLSMLVATYALGQGKTTLVGNVSFTEELSDIWGYADSAGREYAIVGLIKVAIPLSA
jgi:hypothetical protein